MTANALVGCTVRENPTIILITFLSFCNTLYGINNDMQYIAHTIDVPNCMRCNGEKDEATKRIKNSRIHSVYFCKSSVNIGNCF